MSRRRKRKRKEKGKGEPRRETARRLKPGAGARILLCGHLTASDSDSDSMHWWRIDKMQFKRPDGTTAVANWAASCADCFEKSGGQFALLQIRNDAVWNDDKPVLLRNDPGHQSPEIEGELHEAHKIEDIPQTDPFWGSGPEAN